MRFKVFKDGEYVNTIVGDYSFISFYCQMEGLTFEEESVGGNDPYSEMAKAIREGVNEV